MSTSNHEDDVSDELQVIFESEFEEEEDAVDAIIEPIQELEVAEHTYDAIYREVEEVRALLRRSKRMLQ